MQQNEKKFFQERHRKIHHEFNNLTDLELRTFKLLDEEITEDIRRLDQYMGFREIEFEDADALMLSDPFNQALFRQEVQRFRQRYPKETTDKSYSRRQSDDFEPTRHYYNNHILQVTEKVKYDEDQAQVATYSTRQPHSNIQNALNIEQQITSKEKLEQFIQYLPAKIIEDQERTLEDTKIRFIAIISMVVVIYRARSGGAAPADLQKFINKQEVKFVDNKNYRNNYFDEEPTQEVEIQPKLNSKGNRIHHKKEENIKEEKYDNNFLDFVIKPDEKIITVNDDKDEHKQLQIQTKDMIKIILPHADNDHFIFEVIAEKLNNCLDQLGDPVKAKEIKQHRTSILTCVPLYNYEKADKRPYYFDIDINKKLEKSERTTIREEILRKIEDSKLNVGLVETAHGGLYIYCNTACICLDNNSMVAVISNEKYAVDIFACPYPENDLPSWDQLRMKYDEKVDRNYGNKIGKLRNVVLPFFKIKNKQYDRLSHRSIATSEILEYKVLDNRQINSFFMKNLNSLADVFSSLSFDINVIKYRRKAYREIQEKVDNIDLTHEQAVILINGLENVIVHNYISDKDNNEASLFTLFLSINSLRKIPEVDEAIMNEIYDSVRELPSLTVKARENFDSKRKQFQNKSSSPYYLQSLVKNTNQEYYKKNFLPTLVKKVDSTQSHRKIAVNCDDNNTIKENQEISLCCLFISEISFISYILQKRKHQQAQVIVQYVSYTQ
ncbi:MAG: hypothetical protein EZS28_007494 [Streblomastix strix]|uniref:Uncharacterized protein n=1 Tax=Streblomastix strix TaxID=222440 RepID=A0A5J4WPD3_9EUKA|nr:MAG: hypothetical protein EZS28_007494 [Streblomastix strix]